MTIFLLYRIDFCTNITCSAQNEVSEYIKLLKMYNGYKKFHLKYDIDKNIGAEYPREYYTKLIKGNVTLYAYDKYHEMVSKPNIYPVEDIELACNVLRIEIQIEKSKIQNEQNKAQLKNSVEFLVKAITEVQELFEFYLRKLFCAGDYHTYKQAKTIIEKSGYIAKIIERLKKLLKYVSDHNGVQNGINVMKNELLKEEQNDNLKNIDIKIDRMIEKLNAINVNLVTIPRRDNIAYLPNLLTYFND